MARPRARGAALGFEPEFAIIGAGPPPSWNSPRRWGEGQPKFQGSKRASHIQNARWRAFCLICRVQPRSFHKPLCGALAKPEGIFIGGKPARAWKSPRPKARAIVRWNGVPTAKAVKGYAAIPSAPASIANSKRLSRSSIQLPNSKS